MTRFARLTLFLLIFFTLPSASVVAQTPATQSERDSIVVRNVSLLSQTDTAGLKVSIIIISGKLELITTEDIKEAPGGVIYDGNSGFLMGRIEIGQPPSFVVLREDPRERFDIFLNTGA